MNRDAGHRQRLIRRFVERLLTLDTRTALAELAEPFRTLKGEPAIAGGSIAEGLFSNLEIVLALADVLKSIPIPRPVTYASTADENPDTGGHVNMPHERFYEPWHERKERLAHEKFLADRGLIDDVPKRRGRPRKGAA